MPNFRHNSHGTKIAGNHLSEQAVIQQLAEDINRSE
jgi:hypothetical protein